MKLLRVQSTSNVEAENSISCGSRCRVRRLRVPTTHPRPDPFPRSRSCRHHTRRRRVATTAPVVRVLRRGVRCC